MVRVPVATLPPGAAAPPLAGAADDPVELQAAMIAGMEMRPAAPAMPLRTVRRETSTRVSSAMASSSSSDAVRQNPTGSAGLSLPATWMSRTCNGFCPHLLEHVDFLWDARQSLMTREGGASVMMRSRSDGPKGR